MTMSVDSVCNYMCITVSAWKCLLTTYVAVMRMDVCVCDSTAYWSVASDCLMYVLVQL